MKAFWNKYWPNIILAVVVALLLFVFIPAQEKSYLEDDIQIIEDKSSFGLMIFMLLAGVIVWVIEAGVQKKLSRFWGADQCIDALAGLLLRSYANSYLLQLLAQPHGNS